MSILGQIIIACLAGSVLSIILSWIVVMKARPQWVSLLISYAVGGLLGAVFLDVIPEALELANQANMVGEHDHGHNNHIFLMILIGILVFFGLEKAVLWRHNHVDFDHLPEVQKQHDHICDGHHQHHKSSSGSMIMIGDSVHNFVDGVVVAGAFLVSPQLGITTAIAIVAHEIPQEVGDFLVLLHSGYSKKQAFLFNLFSSFTMIIGAVLAYYILGEMKFLLPYLLSFAASSMIYVAIADLIPNLHRKNTLKTSIQQFALICLGILGSMVGHLFE